MKAGNKIKATLILSGLFFISGVQAQSVEYDDLYFNKSDRKAQKEMKNKIKAPTVAETNKNDVPLSTEEYSSKNVNPEYLARYSATESTAYDATESATTTEYTEDDYYIETEERIQDNQSELLQASHTSRPDYYRYPNNSNMNWNMGFGYGMSPGWGMGWGYPYSGFGVSMMWGTGYYGYRPYSMWGNPWYGGWYDPFYDPWYDPWYGSYAWRYGGWYGRPWGGGFYGYNRFYGGVNHITIIENRNVNYARRDSRSATSTVRTSDVRNRISTTDSRGRTASSVRNNSSGRTAGDYARSQNEMYRSRGVDSRMASARNANNVAAPVSRSSSASRISSGRTASSPANTVNRPTRNNTYSTPNHYNTAPSRNSAPAYNNRTTRPASTPSRSSGSYSAPSRSSGSYSTPSRSSGSYSAPSRSSGSSYSAPSRSSGSYSAPSRSSGGSSAPSRSSGGGRR